MHPYWFVLLLGLGMASSQAYAEESIDINSAPANTPLRVDDSEVKSDLQPAQPVQKSKKQLRKPKIGFNNNMKPDQTKSYNRSESGDISSQ